MIISHSTGIIIIIIKKILLHRIESNQIEFCIKLCVWCVSIIISYP